MHSALQLVAFQITSPLITSKFMPSDDELSTQCTPFTMYWKPSSTWTVASTFYWSNSRTLPAKKNALIFMNGVAFLLMIQLESYSSARCSGF